MDVQRMACPLQEAVVLPCGATGGHSIACASAALHAMKRGTQIAATTRPTAATQPPTQVGSLPSKDIPIRAGVTGTPLVVQPQRVLVAGLQGRGDKWCTRLDFGALPAGVPLQRTFYVFNTGSLGGSTCRGGGV